MVDIPGGERFIEGFPPPKGCSADRKHRVSDREGKPYLLRTAPIAHYDATQALINMLEKVSASGVAVPALLELDPCTEGVCSLNAWVDGESLEKVLPLLSETEQYVLGLQSGEIARQMHAIPAPAGQEGWPAAFNQKVDAVIQKYAACGMRFEGDERIIVFLESNRHLLENRPPCFRHGAYHTGNMMLAHGELRVIGFDHSGCGDPWEEFSCIARTAALSPHFATGQLRGYFGEDPPQSFFKQLALYVSVDILSSALCAVSSGDPSPNVMAKQAQGTLPWLGNTENPMPQWYWRDFYIQYIDGVPFKLKSPFDLAFLRKYGEAFKVFDDQDSGNLCFGMANGGKRFFVKFAGAPTARASVSAKEAIANLKRTLPIYRDLAHKSLIRFVAGEEIGGGFAMVFDWVDGECPHPMYPLSRKKFMHLSMEGRIEVFEDIMAFHAHVASKGYVAIDFYDGSILYDFAHEKTILCDIDFYAKMPYVNRMGRLWGSSRFMSPEEYTAGAEIDEITNIYTMGATAFALFSESDRSLEAWPLSSRLYDVVKKAVSDAREERQQSLAQLIAEWKRSK